MVQGIKAKIWITLALGAGLCIVPFVGFLMWVLFIPVVIMTGRWSYSLLGLGETKKAILHLIATVLFIPYAFVVPLMSTGLFSAIIWPAETNESQSVSGTSLPVYAPKIDVIDVSPGKDVSEEKFLLFLLENQLDTITVFSRQKPEKAQPRIADSKAKTQEVISHLQSRKPDAGDFIPHFQEVVNLANSYQAMLSQLGNIEAAVSDKKGESALQAAGSGAVIGFTAAEAFDSGDASGAILSVLGALVSAVGQDRAIEREKKAQIESTVGAFETLLDQARANAVTLADRIAEAKSWERGSLGLERERKSYGQEVLARPANELRSVLADLISQRPQNPFLQQYGITLADELDEGATTVQSCQQWSKQLLEMARLIPSGAAYDSIRRSCIKRSGEMAFRAADMGWKDKKLGDSSGDAIVAASCWKTALSISKSDPDGEIRWQYGRSLALAGDLNEAEAVLVQIKEIKEADPEYHYLMSRMSSAKGNKDAAMNHFKNAVAKGFERISEARNSPDLEHLGKAFGDEWNSLVEVKYEWSVTYGIRNDDITITNKSAFPLTHLTLKPIITNSSGSSYTPPKALTLDRLESGKSHTWVNCISVTGGGDKDTRKAELSCDQSEQ